MKTIHAEKDHNAHLKGKIWGYFTNVVCACDRSKLPHDFVIYELGERSEASMPDAK